MKQLKIIDLLKSYITVAIIFLGLAVWLDGEFTVTGLQIGYYQEFNPLLKALIDGYGIRPAFFLRNIAVSFMTLTLIVMSVYYFEQVKRLYWLIYLSLFIYVGVNVFHVVIFVLEIRYI